MENGSSFVSFLPFIILIVVFYLLIIRPQSKQAKTRQAMLDALDRKSVV